MRTTSTALTNRRQFVVDNRHLNAYNLAIDTIIDGARPVCRAVAQPRTLREATSRRVEVRSATRRWLRAAQSVRQPAASPRPSTTTPSATWTRTCATSSRCWRSMRRAICSQASARARSRAPSARSSAGRKARTSRQCRRGTADYVRTDYLIQYGETFSGDVDVTEGFVGAQPAAAQGCAVRAQARVQPRGARVRVQEPGQGRHLGREAHARHVHVEGQRHLGSGRLAAGPRHAVARQPCGELPRALLPAGHRRRWHVRLLRARRLARRAIRARSTCAATWISSPRSRTRRRSASCSRRKTWLPGFSSRRTTSASRSGRDPAGEQRERAERLPDTCASRRSAISSCWARCRRAPIRSTTSKSSTHSPRTAAGTCSRVWTSRAAISTDIGDNSSLNFRLLAHAR